MEVEGMLFPGLEFEPRDDEIVGCFLVRAAQGLKPPLPAAYFLHQVDLYGNQPPWEIFANQFPASRVFYAMTPLKNASEKRIQRTAGGGTWKGQSVGEAIMVGGVCGEKRSLTYTIDAKSGTKKKSTTHWNMKEYRLVNYHSCKNTSAYVNGGEAQNQQEFVFCRVAYCGKEKPPTSSTLKRPFFNNVNNPSEVEVGIKRPRIMPDVFTSSTVTTSTSLLGGGQDALPSQFFNPQQNSYLGNTCTTNAFSTLEEQAMQPQQSVASGNNNNNTKVNYLEMIESTLFGSHDMDDMMQLAETGMYKELFGALAGPNTTVGGEESSGAKIGQVLDSEVDVTENVNATTSDGLVPEEQQQQQPATKISDAQPNFNAWSFIAILPEHEKDDKEDGAYLKACLESEEEKLQKRRESARKELQQMHDTCDFDDYNIIEYMERMEGRHLRYIPRQSIYGRDWVVSEPDPDRHGFTNSRAHFEKLTGLVLKEVESCYAEEGY